MKQELKSLAIEIRQLKSQRNFSNNGYVHGLSGKQYHARHLHIAYCLIRGRSYEQIENKVRENNEPNWRYVDELKTLHSSIQEAV